MAKRPDAEWRVIGAALTLAESEGWRRVGLARIAEKAGLSLAQTYALFPGKPAILDGFARRIDRAVLEGGAATDEEETARDRLFELLMRRLDAMRPHRAGLKAVLRDTVIVDPPASLRALRVWLGDESKDMAPTMAALDRGLAQAERLANPAAFRPPQPTPDKA
jgi:AcrR family transcriptional regulator